MLDSANSGKTLSISLYLSFFVFTLFGILNKAKSNIYLINLLLENEDD